MNSMRDLPHHRCERRWPADLTTDLFLATTALLEAPDAAALLPATTGPTADLVMATVVLLEASDDTTLLPAMSVLVGLNRCQPARICFLGSRA
jgi:hypothetical protein